MKERKHCPECGLPLTKSTEAQGCPQCLFRLALMAQEDTDQIDQPSPNLPPLPSGLKTRFFGDYELHSEISRGGMGVIFRARQMSLNRWVALKMIQGSQLFSSEATLRFRLEVQAAAKLSHPNIIPLYESGEHDGIHYFTMRLMEGGNLSQYLVQRSPHPIPPLSDRRHPFVAPLLKLSHFLQVVRAVHYAHQRGVLHRDLKPSNILLDSLGELQVADFGLAKMLTQESELTFTESILGSPNYMPPEMAAGRSAEATLEADVYGLGAILYELLTGQAPFRAATPIETIRKVCEESPVSPRKLRPSLDEDIETICLKCLRKTPDSRYPTAEALASDLERWAEGFTILARPLPSYQRAYRWCRRNPLSALALATCLLLLGIGAGGTWIAYHRIAKANQLSQDLVTHMHLQRAEALFTESETSQALAVLSHVLKHSPPLPSTALRTLSALEHRRYALPLFGPVGAGDRLPLASWTLMHDGTELLTVAQNGTMQKWYTQSGTRTHSHYPKLSFLQHARASSDGQSMLAATRDGSLNLLTGPDLQSMETLATIEGGVISSAFSASGRFFATASGRARVQLWATHPPKPVGPPLDHPLLIMDLAFSPDERELTTLCADGKMRFWDVVEPSAHPLRSVDQPYGVLFRYDPSGHRLAVGQHDGGIQVWNLKSAPKLEWKLGHGYRITDLQFNRDGGLLLSAGWDDIAQLWNLTNGLRQTPPFRHAGRVNTARFSEDESLVVTASNDNTARIWETSSGRPITEGLPHQSALSDAVFLPDGKHILTLAYGGAFSVWGLKEPFRPSYTIRHGAPVTAIAISTLGDSVVAGYSNGDLRMFDAKSGKPFSTRSRSFAVGITSLAFSPDSRQIASRSGENEIILIDAKTGQAAGGPISLDRPLRLFEWNSTSDHLLIADWDRVRVLDAASHKQIGELLQHPQPIQSARFSPDGCRIITTSDDRRVRWWDWKTFPPLIKEIETPSGATDASFSPNGKEVLVLPRGHEVFRLSATDGKLLGPLLHHRGSVLKALFSPDGRKIATTSEDQTARIWSADERNTSPLLHTLPHQGRVLHAEFSRDGRWLLTTSADGGLRIWDVNTGHMIADTLRHDAYITSASFAPSGRFTVSGSKDGTLIIRELSEWTEPSTATTALAELANQVARETFIPPDRFEPLLEPHPSHSQALLHSSLLDPVPMGLSSLYRWFSQPLPTNTGNSR